MGEDPPHLLGYGDDETGAGVSVTCDVDTAVIEMSLHGRWSKRMASETYAGFRKCLAQHPAAIIVELHQLADPHAASAALWLAARRAASTLEPPVQVALSLPATEPLSQRLRWIGVTRSVPVYPTTEKARSAVAGHRPLTDWLQLTRRRPAGGDSARAARELIDEACAVWGFPDLRHPARLVVSELVANAVQHAGTDIAVTVWRRPTGLHLSVRDGDPRMPRLRPRLSASGRPCRGGLDIVDTLCAGWGAVATHDGKMVWATMRSIRRTSP
ncbi:ATP-binding protein [Actinoplanes sp. M2I2]|uniref:ATP-binding protein n=1 Tax=Actinoplanes sp. M2I2 TaxID=1734444 RepID=UPI002022235A|nr:ATP-binding protein [Actinoplanes sp. M2I2]